MKKISFELDSKELNEFFRKSDIKEESQMMEIKDGKIVSKAYPISKVMIKLTEIQSENIKVDKVIDFPVYAIKKLIKTTGLLRTISDVVTLEFSYDEKPNSSFVTSLKMSSSDKRMEIVYKPAYLNIIDKISDEQIESLKSGMSTPFSISGDIIKELKTLCEYEFDTLESSHFKIDIKDGSISLMSNDGLWCLSDVAKISSDDCSFIYPWSNISNLVDTSDVEISFKDRGDETFITRTYNPSTNEEIISTSMSC